MDLSAITSPPYVHRPQPYHPKPVEDHRLDHHHTRQESRSSAFHSVASIPSPPELLHDSDEETMSSSSPSEHSSALSAKPAYFLASHKRKSIPHRSPAAVRDAFQASAVDKSVVFQLDVRSQPFFLKPPRHEQQQQQTSEIACTSRVICGESLLTALRTRVAEARTTHHHRRHQTFKQQRSARKTTHIELRRHHHHHQHQPTYQHQNDRYENISPPTSPMSSPQQLPHHTMSTSHTPIMTTESSLAQPSSPIASYSPQLSPEIAALVAPAPPSLPSLPSPQAKTEKQMHQQQHQQQQSIPQQQTTVVHHTSSGRPSRVKGPCQACQESSDGCMRKAFNWPFPTSSIYNDKGRPFVYLCNKCGLRYGVLLAKH